MTEILIESFIYLSAAVIAVPLSKQLGLGSVLGYLMAGVAIGPLFGLVGDETEQIQHVAEFGVVMMLFLVGLELEPEKLWSLRHKLLGLGGLQVLLTTMAFFLAGLAMDLPWSIALAIGLVLSLSSTAIVLQTLNEKGLMGTQGGQSSFSVLLFQDIAVIPMLALVPLLALPELMGHHASEAHQTNLIADLSGTMKALVTFGAIAFIVVGGHYLAQPVFRYIAKARLREIFTAFALLLVIGIAALMSVIGLSPALGTFLAGVVLATSEYRHELESNIEPFKGLLLGLFFITVGAGVDFGLLASQFGWIMTATLGVIAIKFVILFGLGRVFKLQGSDQWLFALSLAQAGEFGFVLLAFTVQSAVIPDDIADKILLVIAISMLLTPLLFIVFDRFINRCSSSEDERAMDHIDEVRPVILAGHGRFGQTVSRVLQACGHQATVIDLDVEAIEGFAKMGYKTYFGDASRPEILSAAGIDQACLLVVAIDDKERALEIVSHARKMKPDLPIVARSFDRFHTYDIYQAGARDIVRETFDSSIRASKLALQAIGFSEQKASEVTELYFEQDRIGVRKMADEYDPSLPRFGNLRMIEVGMTHNEETKQLIRTILKVN